MTTPSARHSPFQGIPNPTTQASQKQPQNGQERALRQELKRAAGRIDSQRQAIARLQAENDRLRKPPALAPCPFCGNTEPRHVHQPLWINGPGEHFIQCPQCRATGPTAQTDQQARQEWERRIHPKP